MRVSGFADSRGDDALNLSLSQERAEMVARELEKAGVPKERMIIEAMGERFASSEAVGRRPGLRALRRDPLRIGHFARQQLSRTMVRCQGGTIHAVVPPDSAFARYSTP